MEKLEDIKVPEGSTLQRDKTHYMLRARVFLGELTLEQLHTLIEVASPYYDKVRLTYRQNIQLYQFPAEELEGAIAHIEAKGMACSGRLGDIVVNALCGYMKEEAFDVLPYAKALWSWLNTSGRLSELPGKFKIAFSSIERDEGNTTIADLGFFAKLVDGKPCFDVYGGGSLGAMPQLSLKLEENLPAERFLEVADKLTKLYIELFQDVKVFKKRLRFKVRELGEEAFIKRYHQEKSEALPFLLKENPKRAYSPQIKGLISCYDGEYGLKIKPVDGELSFASLKAIYNILSESKERVLIRVGSRHELYLLNLSQALASRLKALLPELLGQEKALQREVQTCVGASLCTFGFTNTQALLKSLDEVGDLPRLAISGCMNACPQHQVASLGFFGRKPNPNDFSEELYEIFVGGTLKNETHEGVLSESKGKILAKNIPLFIKDLQKEKGEQSWDAFFRGNINFQRDYIEVS